jgi:hypothetical protein
VGLNFHQLSSLIEALSFTAYVAWYIWWGQTHMPLSVAIFPVWLVASFLLQGDTPKTIGWRADNLWPASRNTFLLLALAILMICGAGVFLGGFDRISLHFKEPQRFVGYFMFCVVQQVGLNSLLTNRLMAAFAKPAPVILLAGALFAALHWPNPVLMPLTFVGGVVMSFLFVRERNILPLALGQAILGLLISWAFPVAWHHAMRVGPGYFTFRR